MDEQRQIVEEFLIEAGEVVDRLDQELVALEKDPQSKSILNSIFRGVHTLKGTCGFLGFKKLESITHVGETLLDGLRAGRLTLSGDITSALLKLIDATRAITQSVSATGEEGNEDYSPLVKILTELNQAPAKAASEPSVEKAPSAPVPAEAAVSVATEAAPVVEEVVKTESAPAPSTGEEKAAEYTLDNLNEDLESLFLKAQQEYAQTATTEAPPALAPVGNEKTSVQTAKGTMEQELTKPSALTAESTPSPEVTVPAPTERTASPDDDKKGSISDSSLRVDVALLDQLMNLVGELVLARNQILQFTKTQSDAEFVSTSQRLNLITSELQEQVMRTRMQPIANVWNKFPRVVRDVARMCGKQVRIEMEGKETDLDKTIIEAIKDPLTHIVRNSVDHGIEMPEARAAKGKDPEGRLLLKAFHEGGHVIIEIADDGAGLNSERIKAKALEKGLITKEKAAKMGEQEVNRLIFLPGFSTAEQVTNISGRGVGMDVVRSNIEKIGGSVDLISTFGAGTTIKIKIPLTLAIVPALIVSSGGERFAIPQVSLVELVRVEGETIFKAIEEIEGANFYRLRGNLLPLVYLNRELELRPRAKRVEEGADSSEELHDAVINIVVVKADERTFGIVVDAVHDTEEIVVKPLGKQLKNISVFAGATIMGDGYVALILDVMGLGTRANVIAETLSERESKMAAAESAKNANTETLLIVQAGNGYRAAIPLALVNRLEEFPISSVESASGRRVVQYRGGILPLIDLPLYFTGVDSNGSEQKQVVVFSHSEETFGFVVDKILDIVEDSVALSMQNKRRGIRGSAIIQKQITDLLDLPAIIEDSAADQHSQVEQRNSI